MSLELIDARIRITHQTDGVVEAIARATGKERSEIMRDVLDKWASDEIHKASLITRFASSDGSARA